jgi:hypothetical protein
MKQLFEVQTKRYKRYYILANGYDEAKSKAEIRMIEKDTSSILSPDGSLNTGYDADVVETIKCLGDELIT